MNIQRNEHPKPQFERENWKNLNGEWQFEVDNGRSAAARGLHRDGVCLSGKICVPFCPESALSGVEHKDFLYGVVYKREFTLREEELSGLVRLHFGAVDYAATVYVNEKEAGCHRGGYVSFALDITRLVKAGNNTVTVIVEDDTRSRHIPSGKQSMAYASQSCLYTRTTGIWQTVWLEFLPHTHVEKIKYYPDITNAAIVAEVSLAGRGTFSAEVFYDGRPVGSYCAEYAGGIFRCCIPLAEKHLWEVGNGRLYTVVLRYGEDRVKSYFGLREVRLDGGRFLINGQSVFQRLVLDQGFYPDGIYTAPSDEALEKDIRLSQAMGFNGARLHEKIFEERFLYHCDRLGYIVWGEYPNWGADHTFCDFIYSFLPEWMEEIERDFNHPAIIGWCPFNETWDQNGHKQFDPAIAMLYDVTKAMDSTRPCIDTSGNYHVKTDIFDVHDYDQNPESFRAHYDRLMTDGELFDPHAARQTYAGEPVFVSEYGGIHWSKDADGWGYGEGPKTEKEFIERFRGLTEALLDNSRIFGLCYTQLTDVEQEQNGLYTYDRRPKFDTGVIREILTRKAAIEEERE